MGATVDPDRVAIYIRWSTEDQAQGHTLAIQRESCHHYALSQGWRVADELTFIDEGCSGASLDRPALTRLREAVLGGLVACVVVYKLDRLSRNIRDTINLVLGEWDGRCCVRSALEPVDTASDAGRLFFALLGSFADFERATIKTRTWSGKLKNAEQGRNPGHPYPYGYCRGDNSTFAVCEAEAAIVRQIFDWYWQGLSCGRIAARLNQQAVPTRAGRGWSDATVAKMLRNPIYTGRLVFHQGAGRPVVVDGAAPVLVDRTRFEQVRRLAGARPRPGRSGTPRAQAPAFLLTGLMRCACGHAVTGYHSTRGAKYYYCSGAHAKGPSVCTAGMIRAGQLDSLLVDQFRVGRGLKDRLREPVLDHMRRPAPPVPDREASIRKRLGGLARRAERIGRDYADGRLAPEAYSALYMACREEQQRLSEALAAAGTKQQRSGESQRDLCHGANTFDQLDEWEALTPAERKEVLQALLASVHVRHDRSTGELAVTCTWRLPPPSARTGG